MILEVLESVLLLAFVVLIVDNVAKNRLNFLNSAEKRHIMALSGRLLVLLLLNVKISLFIQSINKIRFARFEE